MADAIRQAVAEALGIEQRTRAAEQRAQAAEARAQTAEARARDAEARLARVQRDVTQLRMDRFVARQSVIRALPEIASGRIEEAINMICNTMDNTLSDEGGDGWRADIRLQ